MFCRFCGSKVEDESVFCGMCGKNLSVKNTASNNVKMVPAKTVSTPINDCSDITNSKLKMAYYIFGIIFLVTLLLPVIKLDYYFGDISFSPLGIFFAVGEFSGYVFEYIDDAYMILMIILWLIFLAFLVVGVCYIIKGFIDMSFRGAYVLVANGMDILLVGYFFLAVVLGVINLRIAAEIGDSAFDSSLWLFKYSYGFYISILFKLVSWVVVRCVEDSWKNGVHKWVTCPKCGATYAEGGICTTCFNK